MTGLPASVRRQGGVGKLEFLLLVAVIGVLANALLDRLIELEREGERTEIDLAVRNMRVGLRLAVGERLMRGQEDRLPELLEVNPVSFLGRLPRGYSAEAGDDAQAGNWRFDPATRILSYRPRQPEAFGGSPELRWKMESQGLIGGRIAGIQLSRLPDRSAAVR